MFSYKLPFNEQKLLNGLMFELKRKSLYELAHMIKGADISIENGGYSAYDRRNKTRSDALATYIKMHVNPLSIESLENNTEYKNIIVEILDNLIPADVGFDIKEVTFTINLLKDFDIESDILIDLEMQVERISNSILSEILPNDIKVKGFQMSEIYTYLYCIENSIRLFIIKVSKKQFGENYFSSLNISSSMRRTIEERKNASNNRKWLSVRGESELFYLDFKDLSVIIKNNWDIFKNYFPAQEFITSKLDEMADCRNLIAHNSFIGDTERNLIKTYFDVILKQIEENFNDSNKTVSKK